MKQNPTSPPQTRIKYLHNSKAIDQEGNPLIMYHGTPDANFDQFDDGQFFTPDPAYASKYTSSSCASSSYYGVTDNAPAIFPVYLNMESPFDTRLSEHRNIYEKCYHMKFGNGATLTPLGLPDWIEARDLLDFLRNEMPHLGFDSLYVDEGKDDAGQRPIACLVMSPNQIISAITEKPILSTADEDKWMAEHVCNQFEEPSP